MIWTICEQNVLGIKPNQCFEKLIGCGWIIVCVICHRIVVAEIMYRQHGTHKKNQFSRSRRLFCRFSKITGMKIKFSTQLTRNHNPWNITCWVRIDFDKIRKPCFCSTLPDGSALRLRISDKETQELIRILMPIRFFSRPHSARNVNVFLFLSVDDARTRFWWF